MVYQGATPYVTPHILHKHYAQAYDAETSLRECHVPFVSFARKPDR